jgi:hypothetical protein
VNSKLLICESVIRDKKISESLYTTLDLLKAKVSEVKEDDFISFASKHSGGSGISTVRVYTPDQSNSRKKDIRFGFDLSELIPPRKKLSDESKQNKDLVDYYKRYQYSRKYEREFKPY